MRGAMVVAASVILGLAGSTASSAALSEGRAKAPPSAQASSSKPAAPGDEQAAGKPKALQVHFIDVEGGQATLIVSPSGESLLVDAGWPGNDGRDADRIAAAAARAGVSRIDFFVATHYHTDHIGGVPALAERLPIGTFVDHGDSVESGAQPDKLFQAYLAARAKGKHLQVKPGDTVPISGLDVRVVSAGGESLPQAQPVPAIAGLPGSKGGAPNPLCAAFTPREADPSENARSVGILVTFGHFRLLDLGDLTWNKERDLVCPNNPLGEVDVYVTTHHGLDQSNAPVLVHAVRPRVAVMNNGAKKGGSPAAWTTVKSSPGLEALWQLHASVAGGATHNVAEPFIANPDETSSFGLTLLAYPNGSFSVLNERTKKAERYAARGAAAGR